MGNIILGLAEVLNSLLSIYMWVVIIRALLSFVNPDPFNPIVRILNQLTDPLFYWLRRHVPLVYGGMDFSPLVIILAIQFLKFALVRNLYVLAIKLGANM